MERGVDMESNVGPMEEVPAPASGWWLMLLIGLLSVAVGIAFLAQPDNSIETLAVIAGIFLLIDGILELGASLMHSTRNRGTVALVGVVTAIIGVLLIRHPVGGVVAVALLIGLWLIAVGVVRFVVAFDESEHRGWNLAVGAIQAIAGIVIIANPDIGYTTLAVLAGIAFILNGLGMCGLGWSMHSAEREAKAA